MKKLIVILANIVLLLCIMTNIVFGSSETLSLKKVEENEYIEVYLSISGEDVQLMGVQGTLTYDKDALELVEKNVKKADYSITAYNEETGIFMIEVSDSAFYNKEAYIHSNDEFLELKFKVKNKKSSQIKISDVKTVNGNFETNELESKTIDINNQNSSIIIYIAIAVIVLLVAGILIVKFRK